MAADVDADDAFPTVPHAIHALPLRSGRLELVGSAGSIRVGMDRLSIGRSPRCAIVLDDPSVSKVHAEVQAPPEAFGSSISSRSTARSSAGPRSSMST